MCLSHESRLKYIREFRNEFIFKHRLDHYKRRRDEERRSRLLEGFREMFENLIRVNLSGWSYLEGRVGLPAAEERFLPFIKEMLLLAVQLDQPMLVYMAEKVALAAGIVIPHRLACVASEYLALNRPQPPQKVERAKAALALIGGVEREVIYDPMQEYRHIIFRPERDAFLENWLMHLPVCPEQLRIEAVLSSTTPDWVMRSTGRGRKELLQSVEERLAGQPPQP